MRTSRLPKMPRGECEFCPRHATQYIRGSEDDAGEPFKCCALCSVLLRRYDPASPWPRDGQRCRVRHVPQRLKPPVVLAIDGWAKAQPLQSEAI